MGSIESVAEYNGFDLKPHGAFWVLKDRRSGNIAFRGGKQDLEVFLRSMGKGDKVGKFKKGDRVLRKGTVYKGSVLGYSSEPIPGLVVVRFDLGLYPIGVEGSCVHEQELELVNE